MKRLLSWVALFFFTSVSYNVARLIAYLFYWVIAKTASVSIFLLVALSALFGVTVLWLMIKPMFSWVMHTYDWTEAICPTRTGLRYKIFGWGYGVLSVIVSILSFINKETADGITYVLFAIYSFTLVKIHKPTEDIEEVRYATKEENHR